ncbi:UDP-glucose 4-epimerase [Balneicella halophila]|uniref:UDP-glucose 4-epimerase n=1 Tax=Balneicella halophila TaxID=1537566 RepID=A0A7L4UMK6_BALHA|nr:NAD(P)-dependent oxidoreductase [Balneicella halophila]PVX49854.1 UDP-glucose 4-epimerase [Balneicella halophila]
MKVLITGGAGYAGNALVQQLISNKDVEEIRIFDNLSKGKHVLLQQVVKSSKIQFIEGDILDNYKLSKSLQDIDTAVHLATVKQPERFHHYMEQVNHWGTANLINLMEEHSVKRFIFLSSTEVYGQSNKEINLSNEIMPETPYAHSMFRAEKYVKTLENKCEVAIVRIPDIYGYNPAMDFSYGLNKRIFDAKYNALLQLDADGLHKQSAVHVNDLAQLICYLSLTTPEQSIYLANSEHWDGMGIYESLKSFYPNLEATFTSHHLRLQDNIIESDETTQKIIKTKTSLTTGIEELLSNLNY